MGKEKSRTGASRPFKIRSVNALWAHHSRYQKLHLFDVDIKDGPVLKESNSVEAGMEIVAPFETVLGRVGLMICFDVSMKDRLYFNKMTGGRSEMMTISLAVVIKACLLLQMNRAEQLH